jgi:hypothetical protein
MITPSYIETRPDAISINKFDKIGNNHPNVIDKIPHLRPITMISNTSSLYNGDNASHIQINPLSNIN